MYSDRKEKKVKSQLSSSQEKRKKEIEERIAIIENFKMRGRDTIEEYNDLKKELQILTFEDRYSKWFYDNKKILEDLFDSLFKAFTEEGQKLACFTGKQKDNQFFICYKSNELQSDFLKKLLERYGYFVDWWFSLGHTKIGIRIACRKEYI